MSKTAMRAGPILIVGLCLSSCATPPPIIPENMLVASLDQVQALLVAGDAPGATEILTGIEPRLLADEHGQRHELLSAAALHLSGYSWDGYKRIETFTSRYFLSEYEGPVGDLIFEIGRHLIQSDRHWWIFGSDQDDGEIILSEFIGRFPTNVNVAEALMLLGENAFTQRDFEISEERYKELRANHPRSEWAALAAFRLAISSFKLLVGPEYDQAQMTQARRELQDYISLDPERPEFRDEAEQALHTVTRWLAQRELINADFYRQIGNRYGETFHLQSLVDQFPESRPGELAQQRLAAIHAVKDRTDPNR